MSFEAPGYETATDISAKNTLLTSLFQDKLCFSSVAFFMLENLVKTDFH